MYLMDPDPRGSMGLGGTMSGAFLSYGSFIDAIDYKTGKIVWRHEVVEGLLACLRLQVSCCSVETART